MAQRQGMREIKLSAQLLQCQEITPGRSLVKDPYLIHLFSALSTVPRIY